MNGCLRRRIAASVLLRDGKLYLDASGHLPIDPDASDRDGPTTRSILLETKSR